MKKYYNRKTFIALIVLIIIIAICVILNIFANKKEKIDIDVPKEQIASHFDENGDLIIMKKDTSNRTFKLDDGKISVSNFVFTKSDDGLVFGFDTYNDTDEVFKFANKHYLIVCDKDGKTLIVLDGEIVGNIPKKSSMSTSGTINVKFEDVDSIVIKPLDIKDD